MKKYAIVFSLTTLLVLTGCVSDDSYSGCNGIGCSVDNPDMSRVERVSRGKVARNLIQANRPYDGCNGIGCAVDNPDDPENWPLCSDGARHPDCSYAPEGY